MFVPLLTELFCRHYPMRIRSLAMPEMSKILSSVALFSFCCSLFELHKQHNLQKVVLLHSVVYARDILLLFHFNIIRHCPLSRLEYFMTTYCDILQSNNFRKLFILLLLCQPRRYKKHCSVIYHLHVAIVCFVYIIFCIGVLCVVSNCKLRHICFCLESFLQNVESSKY